MMAAQSGHLSTMEYLLSAGCNATAQNVYGETALFNPAKEGHLNIVKALLPRFTIEDLMQEDEEGNTVLFQAAR